MRIVARIILGVAVLLAALALVVVLWRLGPSDPGAWATIAAALAVLTSVIGSWTAQRVLELEEDRQRPQPHLHFDIGSRDNLLLLRLTNSGGSPAFSLSIEWEEPALFIHQSIPDGSREAHFSLTQPEVSVLQPAESFALAVASSAEFLKAPARVYSGSIRFKDSAGRETTTRFQLSAEHYRFALRHDTEDLLTHKKLQRVPKELEGIAEAIKATKERQ